MLWEKPSCFQSRLLWNKKESLQLAAAHQDKPNGWPSTYNPDRIARIGSDCESHWTLDRIGSDWHFRFSCITRLEIHHQLENQCKELFSTELHWEIFCCITNPESKMVERDVSISQRRRLRKSWEWARYNSNDLLSICEWPLQMSLTLFSLSRSLLIPICFSRVPHSSWQLYNNQQAITFKVTL